MSAILKAYIDDAVVHLGEAKAGLYNAGTHIYNAGDSIGAQNWAGAKQSLQLAADDFWTAANRIGSGDLYFSGAFKSALYWINNNWPEIPPEYELTMLKIIDAMVSSTADELETFICIEDAFRAALWDKPFNYEWYAGMVRAFKSWQ